MSAFDESADGLRNEIVRAVMHEYSGKGWDAAYRATERILQIPLVAAAPDMLGALKHCVIERSEWLEEARAAIAKAEGRDADV